MKNVGEPTSGLEPLTRSLRVNCSMGEGATCPTFCRVVRVLARRYPLETHFWRTVAQQNAETNLRCVCKFATIWVADGRVNLVRHGWLF